MRADFARLQGRIFCPDDETALSFGPGKFTCPLCLRVFPVLGNNLVELLPSRPSASNNFNQEYAEDYRRGVEESLTGAAEATSWGAPELMPKKWVERRNRQVRSVLDLLTRKVTREAIVCDLSAGPGYYTFALAKQFDTVLHCDLSAQNLSYAVRRARELGLDNILFVRADYFAVPFQSSLDATICMDSLIRGEAHERSLLGSILKATASDGVALVDFHNWWHNPVRRLGLLRQNFGMNRSYTRTEVQKLLLDCGIKRFSFHPFHQEVEEKSIKGKLLKLFLPPTRFVYLISPRVI
jgi:SAM-dependent methyltransferase